MGRPSILESVCEFVEVRDGTRIYRCRECRRPMQTDNRKGPTRSLPGVLRHDKGGRCASCVDSIRRTGKPMPVGGPKGVGKPTDDELPDRSGLCECGCGQRTAIATRTVRAAGKYRGVPNRFVQGHGAGWQHRRDDVAEQPAAVLAVADGESAWKARAACRDTARPQAFDMPDRWTYPGPTPDAQQAARRYCARCPVLDECEALADELAGGAYPVTGLWAGEWRTTAGRQPIRTASPIRELADAGAA